MIMDDLDQPGPGPDYIMGRGPRPPVGMNKDYLTCVPCSALAFLEYVIVPNLVEAQSLTGSGLLSNLVSPRISISVTCSTWVLRHNQKAVKHMCSVPGPDQWTAFLTGP